MRWSESIKAAGRQWPVVVILFYLITALMVQLGVVGQGWQTAAASGWAPSNAEYWLGTNRAGQDIFARLLHGVKVAVSVGGIVAAGSLLLGLLIGALSGLFRDTWWDAGSDLMMNLIDSIPFYLLVIVLGYSLKGVDGAHLVAMILCFWTTSARVFRAEVIRLRETGFIKIAKTMGMSRSRILFSQLLPNLKHLIVIQLIIVMIVAIKAEVVLSYLGVGTSDGVSWGMMIAEATSDLMVGHYSNFLSVTVALFLLVFSLNLIADRYQAQVINQRLR